METHGEYNKKRNYGMGIAEMKNEKERRVVFPDRWMTSDILWHIYSEIDEGDSVDRIYAIISTAMDKWIRNLRDGEELVFSKGLSDSDGDIQHNS